LTVGSDATVDGVVTVDRVINATTSSDPWLKGVNGSNTETFFLKPSGQAYFGSNVGIGTSSPDQLFHVKSSGNTRAKIEAGTTSSFGQLYLGTENQFLIGYGSTHANEPNHIGLRNANASGEIFFVTGGSAERMRIDSSGNVGIGSSSTDALESRTAQGYRSLRLNNFNINAGEGAYGFIGQNIYQDSAGVYKFIDTGDSSSIHFWGNAMQFHMANGSADATQSGSERMRIDSSGNLLVGKTSVGVGNLGIELRNNNLFAATRANDPAIYANRTSSDGAIIELRKDNSVVGTIGCNSGLHLVIGKDDTGLNFQANETIAPSNPSTGSVRDNAIDLGSSSARFDDIYATNGTIQTSDRNEKQDIEELSDAEQRVAVVAKGLMRKFRWKDSVAEKGDNARTHFGIIAQDLQDAFTAEGLDAGDYAMFTSDTWTDDDGNEQTRLGVRYNQLLAFIISAI
jgi:hypothetical protein